MHEHTFICPYCWQQISMLLDGSVEQQTYIEDCEVCCRPIQVHYRTEHGAIVTFRAERIGQ
jgi:hypothetical protein